MRLADLGDRPAEPPSCGEWSQHVDEVAEEFDTDPQLGLSAEEAAGRLSEFGPNELETAAAVPLLATQILWINLVTDGPLALALGVDPSVENVMDRPHGR